MANFVYIVTSCGADGERVPIAVYTCERAAQRRADEINEDFKPKVFSEMVLPNGCEC